MQTAVTGNYIIFGTCETYSQQLDNHKSSINDNQVQASRLTPKDEKVLTSILYEMIIKDEVHMEVQQESD